MRKAPELARRKFPDSEEPVALLRREPPFEIRLRPSLSNPILKVVLWTISDFTHRPSLRCAWLFG
jgi:hypothetical protein